jgi:hypothetical protein
MLKKNRANRPGYFVVPAAELKNVTKQPNDVRHQSETKADPGPDADDGHHHIDDIAGVGEDHAQVDRNRGHVKLLSLILVYVRLPIPSRRPLEDVTEKTDNVRDQGETETDSGSYTNDGHHDVHDVRGVGKNDR